MAKSIFPSIIQFITILIVFIGILGLTYVVTKKIAYVKQGSMKGKNLQIIEVLQLGQGQYLYIIRIGKDYHLMNGTKERIEYCTLLDKEQLNLEQDVSHSFNQYLEYFKQGKQERKDENK